MRGAVSRWFDKQGWGFIKDDSGVEYFAHYSYLNFDATGKKNLIVGEEAIFDATVSSKGPMAINIRRVEQ